MYCDETGLYCDETGLFYLMLPDKTLAAKDQRNEKAKGQRHFYGMI